MTEDAMAVVDTGDFRRLFVEHLGWGSPTQTTLTVSVDGSVRFPLTQVATYRGMGVWHCPAIPDLRTQRLIDSQVAAKNTERLIIYTDGARQEWRWPRYTRHRSSGRPALIPHRHTAGNFNPNLRDRLAQITIPMGSQITVPELLQRMRDAFDVEAETAAKQAARLMGALFSQLEAAGMGDKDSSEFLARILFLMFGDDTEMWKSRLFHDFLAEHTALDGSDLADRLSDVFRIANTPEERRPQRVNTHLARLPYINGGIFESRITIPELGSEFRRSLIEACRFDWGQISPAVFGSMFQTVKDREARRALGEHYTTETAILKTLGPLFLDNLHERLDSAWDNKAELTKLHNHLGRLQFLDPACGCGNFLIVAYRELRAIELELLKRRRDLDLEEGKAKRAQLSLDATIGLKVTLEQFHGIEIESWPARIAETAMFLVDHQANLRMESELGGAPSRLPIELSPHIHVANALTVDWTHFLTPSDQVLVFGNPPFSGHYTRSEAQAEEARQVWGRLYTGKLDYVTCWHKKTIDFFEQFGGRWAFVSTNSICQGEPVAALWEPILAAGWRARFAHRSMKWESEAAGAAAVHVSIVGFDREGRSPAELWEYPEGGVGDPIYSLVANINPYLVAGPNVLVRASTSPITSEVQPVHYGSMPNDGGWLILNEGEYEEAADDAVAMRYVRPFVGAEELLQGKHRWCLWLDGVRASDWRSSAFVKARVRGVKEVRVASRRATTRALAATPHLFGEIRQPETAYLAIPRVVSERRHYYTVAYLTPDVIASDALLTASDPSGFLFAMLSSSVFMTWQRTIGGRLKSDLRFSAGFSYNTFPMPIVDREARAKITHLGLGVMAARAAHQDVSLADLYDPVLMPPDLSTAHAQLDAAVDQLFGVDSSDGPISRQERLFTLYQELISQGQLVAPPAARKKQR